MLNDQILVSTDLIWMLGWVIILIFTLVSFFRFSFMKPRDYRWYWSTVAVIGFCYLVTIPIVANNEHHTQTTAMVTFIIWTSMFVFILVQGILVLRLLCKHMALTLLEELKNSTPIPPTPKTQEELQAWINELEKPVQMRNLAGAKLAAKKSACLMGVRQTIAMNADPELFWVAIGDLWRTYHKD